MQPKRRVLHTIRFAFLSFVLVAGGPFGYESAVRAAGPLPCFVGFLLVPLVWSLPQALSTAELSTHLPDSGGSVIWATRAFGDLAGWIAGINGLLASVLDLGLYPALVSQSLVAVLHSHLSPLSVWAISASAIGISVGLNLAGLRALTTFSALATAAVMAPFGLSFLLQLQSVASGGWAWAQIANTPDWPVFVSTLLWSYSGWDSLGTFAGEVENPKVTYVRGTILTLLAAIVSYAVPVFVSVQTHPNFQKWEPGSLVLFCGDVAAPLLALAAFASFVSPLATMAAGLSASTRIAWALAGGCSTDTVRHLPAVIAVEWVGVNGSTTPVVSILLHAAIVLMISGTSFQSLVQLVMVLSSVRVALNTAAFIRLRSYRVVQVGHVAPTAFEVPGGALGVVLVAAPQFAVAFCLLLFVDRMALLLGAAVNAVSLFVFALRAWNDRARHGKWWPRGYLNLATDAAEKISRGASGVPDRAGEDPEGCDTSESDLDDKPLLWGRTQHRHVKL